MFAFLSGAKLYALIGIGVVILALAGAVAYQRQIHRADVAELANIRKTNADLTDALKQSEADKAVLAQKARELDSAIQERDQRLKALNDAKRKLADELDRIKKSVSPEDRSCLDRPLPDGILDLLRGSASGDKDGTGNDSGKPAPAVPQV